MAYDINKALERLEKNLCDVDSARKQVEKTVACSTDLQNIVNGYVASLDSLVQDIEQLINDLTNYKSLKTTELETSIKKIEDACERTMDSFNKMVADSSVNFKKKLNAQVEDLVTENNKLSNEINRLDENQEPLEKAISVSNELVKRISNLSDGVDKFYTEETKSLDSIKASIATLTKSVNEQQKNFSAEINEQKGKLANIAKQTNEILTIQANMKNELFEIKSKINKNQWIIIIGIVIIIVLHFVQIKFL